MAGVQRNLVARAGIDISAYEKGLKKMQKSLEKTSKKIGDIGKKMSMAFTVPLLGLATVGLKTASDLQEVQNVVDVSFGKSSKAVDEWAKTTLNAYGLSELSAKKYASTIRAMTGSMGLSTIQADKMSMSIAELAGDMASFYNLSTDEAFEKLRSGISGETEPLKQLGINLSVANLEAYALSQGITTLYQDMSEAEKVTLRYQYIMSATSKAQGDFSRTSGSAANQMRLAKEQFLQASATLMQSFLPALTELLTKVNQALTWFSNLDTGTQKFIVTVGILLAALGPLLTVYSNLIKLKAILVGWYQAVLIAQQAETASTAANNAVKQVGILTMMKTIAMYAAHKIAVVASTVATAVMSGATWAATVAQWALNAAFYASPVGWIALAIIGLIAVFVLLWKNLDGFKKFFVKMWEYIVIAVKFYINYIIFMLNMYLKYWKFMINGTITLVNLLIKGINKVPGIEIPLIPKLAKDSLQIPKLAKGGIAYGNTIANVGEYPGARSNPEVIAPLDKLKSMLDTGGKTIILINEMDGQVLTKTVLRNAGGTIRLKNG